MKKLFVFAVMAAGLASLGGCATSTKKEAATSNAKPYPLATCLVTDEKLGGHGEATVFIHEGQEVKLCCDGCKEDFEKDPQKYLTKLQTPK